MFGALDLKLQILSLSFVCLNNILCSASSGMCVRSAKLGRNASLCHLQLSFLKVLHAAWRHSNLTEIVPTISLTGVQTCEEKLTKEIAGNLSSVSKELPIQVNMSDHIAIWQQL